MAAVPAATPVASAAAPSRQTALGTGFGALVVDDANRQVFVSSPTANQVTVLNFDGAITHVITGIAGASSMVVHGSRLYVAAKNAGAVYGFDTGSFGQVASLGAGSLLAPNTLAFANGLLWTSTGTCGAYPFPHLVSIDPATGHTTAFPAIQSMEYCPVLTSDPADASALLGFDFGLSPTTITRLDVSTDSPVVVTTDLNSSNSESNMAQLAVYASGDAFVSASGAPYQIDEHLLSSTAPDGVIYPTGAYPTAVDAAAGYVAAGLDSSTGTVQVFVQGDPADKVLQFDGGSDSNVLWKRGIAISGDGTRVFAVTGDPFFSEAATFDVLPLPARTATTTSVAASPTTAAWGGDVTLTATVTGSSASGTATFLDGSAPIGPAVVANGHATIHTSGLTIGTHTITVRYSGDAANQPSTSTPIAVTVTKVATRLALRSSANPSVYGKAVLITADISDVSAGAAPTAATGTVTFKVSGRTVGQATVNNGSATVSLRWLLPGSNTIVGIYSGDVHFTASTSPKFVQQVIV